MSSTRIEILLVEDSASDVRLTQEALKSSSLNYNLSVVSDGEEAMKYLSCTKDASKSKPDVILLDLNMPKKNGHEVLTEIKQDPGLASIPIVLLTVSQRDQDILEALHLKMNYYLAKPVDAEKLAVLLNAIFELHAQDIAAGTSVDREREDLHVRLVLAGNPHTAPVVLRKLAVEINASVRCRVAENPNTPQDVLLELTRDKEADVRIAVADNPKIPGAVLTLLAKDPSDDVRLGLAENPNLPSEILQNLSRDENIFISSSASKTLSHKGVSLV
jgi:chemotaxis family two-component system response regulator Rcp1